MVVRSIRQAYPTTGTTCSATSCIADDADVRNNLLPEKQQHSDLLTEVKTTTYLLNCLLTDESSFSFSHITIVCRDYMLANDAAVKPIILQLMMKFICMHAHLKGSGCMVKAAGTSKVATPDSVS